MSEQDLYHQDPAEGLGGSFAELALEVRDRIWAEEDLFQIYTSVRRKAKKSRLSEHEWQAVLQPIWEKREQECRLLLENAPNKDNLPAVFQAYVKEGTLSPKVCQQLLSEVSQAEAKRLRGLIDVQDPHVLPQLHNAYQTRAISREMRDLLLRLIRNI